MTWFGDNMIISILLQDYTSFLSSSNTRSEELAFIPLLGLIYFVILMFRSTLLYESIQQKLRENHGDHTPLNKGK